MTELYLNELSNGCPALFDFKMVDGDGVSFVLMLGLLYPKSANIWFMRLGWLILMVPLMLLLMLTPRKFFRSPSSVARSPVLYIASMLLSISCDVGADNMESSVYIRYRTLPL